MSQVCCAIAIRVNPHFSRQNCRGRPLRLPREVRAWLGCVIEWDKVQISRMGGRSGPPLQMVLTGNMGNTLSSSIKPVRLCDTARTQPCRPPLTRPSTQLCCLPSCGRRAGSSRRCSRRVSAGHHAAGASDKEDSQRQLVCGTCRIRTSWMPAAIQPLATSTSANRMEAHSARHAMRRRGAGDSTGAQSGQT